MVKIRLMRMGKKQQPSYRVVVADSRSPRDGRFIENIGRYQPRLHPSLIEIDEERALHWLQRGARPSDPVRVLFHKSGIWSRFTGEAPPQPAAPEPTESEAEAEAEAAAQETSQPEPSEPLGSETDTTEATRERS